LWEKSTGKYIVYIDELGGVDQKKEVKSSVISNELNVANRKALGLIVDADNNCASRWQSVRNACLKFIPDLPLDLPPQGFPKQKTKVQTINQLILIKQIFILG